MRPCALFHKLLLLFGEGVEVVVKRETVRLDICGGLGQGEG